MKCKCGCGIITPIAKRNRKELGHIKGKHIDYLGGHKMRGIKGENHHNFKGDNVGYKAFHLRVSSARGKALICKNCGSDNFVEWANISGRYGDIFDYKELCRKCHNAFDNIANKVAQLRRARGDFNKSSIEAGTKNRIEGGGLRE